MSPAKILFFEILFWTLCGIAWVVLGVFTAVAIGRVCRVDVERPGQRARRVMRRQSKWDVQEAVERALRADAVLLVDDEKDDLVGVER